MTSPPEGVPILGLPGGDGGEGPALQGERWPGAPAGMAAAAEAEEGCPGVANEVKPAARGEADGIQGLVVTGVMVMGW